MPYELRKGTGPRKWKIVKKATGKVVGTSTTEAKAKASIRARYNALNEV